MAEAMRFASATCLLALVATAGCASNGANSIASDDIQPSPNNYVKQAQALSSNSTPSADASGDSSIWDNPVSRAVKSATQTVANPATPMRMIGANDPLSLDYPSGPPTASLFVSLGLVAEQGKNDAKAREFYQKALDTDNNSVEALLAFGHFEDRTGNLAEAAQYYARALEVDPLNAGAHNDLALCYARQDRVNEAAQLLTKAIELAPEKPLYRNNLARVLVEQGMPQQAIAQLTPVISQARANYNVAWFLAQSGKNDQAATYFERAAQLDPKMHSARAWLAKVRPNETDASAVAVRPMLAQQAAVAAQPGPSQRPVIVQGNGGTSFPPTGQALVRTPQVTYGQAPLAPQSNMTTGYSTSSVSAAPQAMGPASANAAYQTTPPSFGSNSVSPVTAARPVADFGSTFGGTHDSPWGEIGSPYGDSQTAPTASQRQPSCARANQPATRQSGHAATLVNPFAATPAAASGSPVYQATSAYPNYR